MLPKRLRLSRAEFGKAAAGTRATSAHFSVTVRRNAENGGAAAVISKKVAKKAVDRHLLKRRILEALRPEVFSDRSIIVYARAGAPTLSYAALKQELSELLGKVG
ncbi:MAG TPA: ribonuclease P protein component [Candidatus Paceibacterota bacterium]|nr:ribonuclease P protein component [Candidatus Paceibacterota bacterium]